VTSHCGNRALENAVVSSTLGRGDELMAAQTPNKVDVKGWITLIVSLCVFIGGIVWAAHKELAAVDSKIEGLDKRTTKIETALRLLADSQGGKTKELIDDALAAAKIQKDFGNEQASARLLRTIQKIIEEEKTAKAEAPQTFFLKRLEN
jgi:hypothetical protein